MPAPEILAAIDGAIALVEKLAPLVTQLFQQGEVTIEQQAALKERIIALSKQDAFSGPEWEVSNDS